MKAACGARAGALAGGGSVTLGAGLCRPSASVSIGVGRALLVVKPRGVAATERAIIISRAVMGNLKPEGVDVYEVLREWNEWRKPQHE